MLIYKCDYCGAEYEFDGVGRVCPKCGADISASADSDPDSLRQAASEPIKVALAEPIVIDTGGKPLKAHRGRSGSAVKAVLITVIVMVIAFFAFIIIIASLPEILDDDPAAAFNYTHYTEEGHSPGDPYTGDMKLSMDLSEYKMVSWTSEPVLMWGVPGETYSADRLYIHGRIHNETDSKIDISLKLDIIGTDGVSLGDNYISLYDVLEGQDELIEECLYVYLPITYDQIGEIKLNNCSITVN
jgi:hypothetical protein